MDRLNLSRQDLSFDIYHVPIRGEQRNLIFENVPERHYLKSEYGTRSAGTKKNRRSKAVEGIIKNRHANFYSVKVQFYTTS